MLSNKKAPFQELSADRTGLEPATSAVTGRHSNQLNYRSFFSLGCKDNGKFPNSANLLFKKTNALHLHSKH
jgi:hypothetical protein